MRFDSSAEKRRPLRQDVAGRCEEVDVDAAEADDDWNVERMIFADEFEKSGICWKTKKTQRICGDGSEAVTTFVLEVIDLSHREETR